MHGALRKSSIAARLSAVEFADLCTVACNPEHDLDRSAHPTRRALPQRALASASATSTFFDGTAASPKPLLHAVLQASRRELGDLQLLRLLVSHPLVTLKVVGAIHWEALRLWSKRLKLRPHTATLRPPVTGVISHERSKSSHA